MIHKIIHSLHIYKNKQEFYQTGLIALWEAQQRFDPNKGHFAAYAYKYMKGRMLTEIKKDNRYNQKIAFLEEEFWEKYKDVRLDSVFETDELFYSFLKGCRLTESQLKWVMYSCLRMLSVREIAEMEGVSVSAVKQWKKGAKEKLKSWLVETKTVST